jgi:hypothetical protein
MDGCCHHLTHARASPNSAAGQRVSGKLNCQLSLQLIVHNCICVLQHRCLRLVVVDPQPPTTMATNTSLCRTGWELQAVQETSGTRLRSSRAIFLCSWPTELSRPTVTSRVAPDWSERHAHNVVGRPQISDFCASTRSRSSLSFFSLHDDLIVVIGNRCDGKAPLLRLNWLFIQ